MRVRFFSQHTFREQSQYSITYRFHQILGIQKGKQHYYLGILEILVTNQYKCVNM